MSFRVHMKGYDDLRTLYQIDSLYAWQHNLFFPPVMVEISPTHKCNQLCRYCYSNTKGESGFTLEDEVLINCVNQLSDIGVQALLIQGTGEPLIHKALPGAIEIGAKRKIPMGLTTNGVLLTKGIQERVMEHLFYIRFSVLERDSKRYAYLHGCSEKQWEILVNNIEYAVTLRKKHDLKVALWATVYLYKENFSDAYNIIKFYKDMGIDYIVVQEATYIDTSPAGKGRMSSNEYSVQEIDEMKKKVMALSDDNFQVKVRFPLNDDTYSVGMYQDSWKTNYCQGIFFYTTISADGEVYPCWRLWGKGCDYSYGNLKENTFEEIWKGEKRKRIVEYVNSIPPSGDECAICNITKLNEILFKCRCANSKWKGFLI